MLVYQAHGYVYDADYKITEHFDREFEDKDEAKIWGEAQAARTGKRCELITWHKWPNLPHLKPDWRYDSCALEIFDPERPKDGWRAVDIFGQ